MKLTKEDIAPLLDIEGITPLLSTDNQIKCYWVSNYSLVKKELNFDNCSLKYLPVKGWDKKIEKLLLRSFKLLLSDMIVNEPPKIIRVVLRSQKLKVSVGIPFAGKVRIGDPAPNEILEDLKSIKFSST